MIVIYLMLCDDVLLVVFDFDYILYDGDLGSYLFVLLIKCNLLWLLVVLLVMLIVGLLVVMLLIWCVGILVYVWIVMFGLYCVCEFNCVIDVYVFKYEFELCVKLLLQVLVVFVEYWVKGDCVVVVIGVLLELVWVILVFVVYQGVLVIGSEVGFCLGVVGVMCYCYNEEKMWMLCEWGYGDIDVVYLDSMVDLLLLLVVKDFVVVNFKYVKVVFFCCVLKLGICIFNWGCVDRGGDMF